MEEVDAMAKAAKKSKKVKKDKKEKKEKKKEKKKDKKAKKDKEKEREGNGDEREKRTREEEEEEAERREGVGKKTRKRKRSEEDANVNGALAPKGFDSAKSLARKKQFEDVLQHLAGFRKTTKGENAVVLYKNEFKDGFARLREYGLDLFVGHLEKASVFNVLGYIKKFTTLRTNSLRIIQSWAKMEQNHSLLIDEFKLIPFLKNMANNGQSSKRLARLDERRRKAARQNAATVNFELARILELLSKNPDPQFKLKIVSDSFELHQLVLTLLEESGTRVQLTRMCLSTLINLSSSMACAQAVFAPGQPTLSTLKQALEMNADDTAAQVAGATLLLAAAKQASERGDASYTAEMKTQFAAIMDSNRVKHGARPALAERLETIHNLLGI